jgi:hypothetical protein
MINNEANQEKKNLSFCFSLAVLHLAKGWAMFQSQKYKVLLVAMTSSLSLGWKASEAITVVTSVAVTDHISLPPYNSKEIFLCYNRGFLSNKEDLQTNPKHELALQGILMQECHFGEDGKQCTKGYEGVQPRWRCIC